MTGETCGLRIDISQCLFEFSNFKYQLLNIGNNQFKEKRSSNHPKEKFANILMPKIP